MKRFKDLFEKREQLDVEKIGIDITNDGEDIDQFEIYLTVDTNDIEDSGADYGEDDSYTWVYDWIPKDKRAKSLIKKYKLEKLIDKLEFTSGKWSPNRFKDDTTAWVDIGTQDSSMY